MHDFFHRPVRLPLFLLMRATPSADRSSHSPRGSSLHLTGRFLSLLLPYWGNATGAFISLILMIGANLASPVVIRQVIDGIETELRRGQVQDFDWSLIITSTLILSGLAIGRGVFNFLQNYLSEKNSQSIAFDLRNQIYTKVQSLSFSYHDQAQTGQLMTRATNDVELVRQFMGQGLFQMIASAFMFLGALAALAFMNLRLATIVFLIIPFNMVLLGLFMRAIRPLFGEIQGTMEKLNERLQENLAGIRVVKAFARSHFEIERFAQENEHYRLFTLNFINRISKMFPATFLISNVQLLFVLAFGGRMVILDQLSIGTLTAFISYLIFMTQPLMTVGFLSGMMIRALVSAERIFEVLDTPSELHDAPDAQPLGIVVGRVTFQEVFFRYAGQEDDVLKGISFTARPGQSIAIMGRTGSGKSSIINLLPRFYDVTGGRVTIDGKDVRQVTLDSLRSQIGIVLQEAILFTGTIRENIAYGRPEATMEAIQEAAAAAAAHDFIMELPEAYATRVGERGVGLSGGQRQRIAIARALLLDPRILILDDSTSAVDAETEHHILEALKALMQGRTAFVIAQRIATVREADQVLLLEHGRIADMGTHDELMRDSALYAEIVQSQFKPETSHFIPVAATAQGNETPPLARTAARRPVL